MKTAVGISGGVDSAVAALLLRREGRDLVGVTMTLGRPDEERSLAEARSVARCLDIPLEVVDLSEAWRREVREYVRASYLAGLTPNPCVRCNETVKFSLLPRYAFDRLGCDRFATGHYARLETAADGSRRLLRGLDRAKDQSYFLYRVPAEILKRTDLPLGGMTKGEVREVARRFGFEAADRSDSQDFCGGEVRAVVGAADREGDIVTADGKVLGRHRGYWNYTVGMRRGLGIGGGTPYFVTAIRPETNEVVVGFREAAVAHSLSLRETVGRIDFSKPVKVRSAGEPRLLADGILGVAPGQSAVFYDGDAVLGGGIICVDGRENE